MKEGAERPNNLVTVWDPLVRVFHWSLVLFFVMAYLTEGDWLKLHAHAGYSVALLILFRILWGIIGFGFARFAEFVVTPGQSLSYLRRLIVRRSERFVGHNPAGGAMALILFFVLLLTTCAGMCLLAMEGAGPLAGTTVTNWSGSLIEAIHYYSANFALVLIGIHVSAVVFSSFLHHENLAIAMLTGRKRKER